MATAEDFVRVVYGGASTDIFIDGRIRTYSGIAEAAAVKHLGMTLLDAHVPASALFLRGPVVAASKLLALGELKNVGGLELSDEIDHARVSNGAWFLLEINGSSVGEWLFMPRGL